MGGDIIRLADRTRNVTVELDGPTARARREGRYEAEIVIRTGFVTAQLPVHLTDADLADLAGWLSARAAAEEAGTPPDGAATDWPESGRSAYLRLHAADPFVVEIRDPVQSGVTVTVPLELRDGWAARAAARLDVLRAGLADGS
ncbi:DUF5959 family protein [Kitasatospora sp. NPDC089913]|uniref:DUF5959 family protein n=1 Tax=Streptomycetaceae TaxID=2062 RepID=UPI00087A7A5E|nr:DUF5959 family protein [Streptomyces sp. TLI_053]SDS78093.1 hypothetical protein SAMN05216371_0602 [Streptomyces sp. TLI_053]